MAREEEQTQEKRKPKAYLEKILAECHRQYKEKNFVEADLHAVGVDSRVQEALYSGRTLNSAAVEQIYNDIGKMNCRLATLWKITKLIEMDARLEPGEVLVYTSKDPQQGEISHIIGSLRFGKTKVYFEPFVPNLFDSIEDISSHLRARWRIQASTNITTLGD